MQKPTRVYVTRAYTNNDIRGCTKYTPWASTTALFSKMTNFEISQVSTSQKQALVNAI